MSKLRAGFDSRKSCWWAWWCLTAIFSIRCSLSQCYVFANHTLVNGFDIIMVLHSVFVCAWTIFTSPGQVIHFVSTKSSQLLSSLAKALNPVSFIIAKQQCRELIILLCYKQLRTPPSPNRWLIEFAVMRSVGKRNWKSAPGVVGSFSKFDQIQNVTRKCLLRTARGNVPVRPYLDDVSRFCRLEILSCVIIDAKISDGGTHTFYSQIAWTFSLESFYEARPNQALTIQFQEMKR